MNIWISKDGAWHHYHTSHRSICGISDILQDMANTHDTAENPDTKCKTCIGILTSKGFFKVNLDKNRNDAREAKFLQKYRTSPVSLFVRYFTSPENRTPITLKRIRHELAGQFDGINTNDILSEAIVRGDIIHENGNFYPKSQGEIIL